MPYEIVKSTMKNGTHVKSGYRVRKKKKDSKGKYKYFSKKPLSLSKARAQLRVLEIRSR